MTVALAPDERPRSVVVRDRAVRVAPIVLPVLLALVLGVRRLLLPHVLFGMSAYDEDDAIYLGAAVRLVHGSLPYRDFVFLQPPGITVIMAPLAALGSLVGLAPALVVARLLVLVVTAANAGLAASLLRPRGRAAAVLAGGAVAAFPFSAEADVSLKLEPFVVLGTLLGSQLVLRALRRPDHGLGSGRLLVGGAILGLTVTVKLWALFPLAGLLLACLPHARVLLRRVVPAVAVGTLVPVLPFLVASPRQFVYDIFLVQAQRAAGTIDALTTPQRLDGMTGIRSLQGPPLHPLAGSMTLLVLTLATLLVIALTRGQLMREEWFLIGAVPVTVGALLIPSEFYPYYAYQPGVYVALLAVAVLARTAGGLRIALMRLGQAGSGRGAQRGAFLVGLAVIALAVHQQVKADDAYLAGAYDDSDVVAAIVPIGSCVVFDQPDRVLLANRFTSARSGCPPVTDPYGSYLAADPADPPPRQKLPPPAAYVEQWRGYFDASDFVVLGVPFSSYLPWTSELEAYFTARFQLVYNTSRTYVYVHAR